MASYRFPTNVEDNNRPYVLFSTHKAQYNNVGSATNKVPTTNSVALYLPPNYNVNDIIRWENESTGAVGFLFERYGTEGRISQDDFKAVAEAVAVERASSIGGAIAAGLSFVGAGALAGIAGGAGTASVVGNVKSELLKDYQRTLNPRDFMLFKAPGIRQFGFNFIFIPSNKTELEAIPKIIKFFRAASYPSLHADGIQFNFPDAFTIKFGNSPSLIKMPEVVCIGTSITYNPNSMSYYKLDNTPVEINLQLSFQELQPIERSLVEKGF